MANKDKLAEFYDELRQYHEQEVRRAFVQPGGVSVPPSSVSAAHKALARVAQVVRRGENPASQAVVLGHRAYALWLAGTDAIGDPQQELFPDDGMTVAEVEELVESENERIQALAESSRCQEPGCQDDAMEDAPFCFAHQEQPPNGEVIPGPGSWSREEEAGASPNVES